MKKDWKVTDLLHILDITYKDIDHYFIDPIPLIEHADRQYKAISLEEIDLSLSVIELLDKG